MMRTPPSDRTLPKRGVLLTELALLLVLAASRERFVPFEDGVLLEIVFDGVDLLLSVLGLLVLGVDFGVFANEPRGTSSSSLSFEAAAAGFTAGLPPASSDNGTS